MKTSHARSLTPQLVIGIFITLFGGLLLLNTLGIVRQVHLFLPLGMMAVGAALLLVNDDRHRRFWGGFWLLLGLWVLANRIGWVRVGFLDLLLPLVLLLVGARLVLHALGRPDAATGERQDGSLTLFSFMSGSNRTSSDTAFTGAEMTAILGGCKLDLRQAAIPDGQDAVIRVFTVMGGQEIWVPPGWLVDSNVVLLLGGLEDKRLPVLDAPSGVRPRLRLEGFALMGGIEIKS